jgi:hypothetical protein
LVQKKEANEMERKKHNEKEWLEPK